MRVFLVALAVVELIACIWILRGVHRTFMRQWTKKVQALEK